MKKSAVFLFLSLLSLSEVFSYDTPREYDRWWNDDWYENGIIDEVVNHKVDVRWKTYTKGDADIPVMIAKPDKPGKFPVVLFVHGRRGLDDLLRRHVKRVAARGFLVFAPDLYVGRFVAPMPIEHDYQLEKDLDAVLPEMFALPEAGTNRACMYSHTRGGYYTLKVAVSMKRQKKDIACYVSYYPHWQDPNLPEPMQVYRYAEEIEDLDIPTLIFIGDKEQYQRRRGIEMAIHSMQKAGKDAHLIIYPGVGRGFDFRAQNVRTFADDLAAKDAIQRASRFMNAFLSKHSK